MKYEIEFSDGEKVILDDIEDIEVMSSCLVVFMGKYGDVVAAIPVDRMVVARKKAS